MRTGADYLSSRSDGRRVWTLGVGRVDDVARHPATAAMTQYYADWYDRLRDPHASEVLFTSPQRPGEARRPWCFEVPTTVEHVRRMGAAFRDELLRTAGNVTHNPAYGGLLALGLVDLVSAVPDLHGRVDHARALHRSIVTTGRFITFASRVGAVSDRFRPAGAREPAQKIREVPGGIIVAGTTHMHTAAVYADDVLVLGGDATRAETWAWFTVPLSAKGVTIVSRSPSSRQATSFAAPLSSRFDELDSYLTLDQVFVPQGDIYLEGREIAFARHQELAVWILWHQILGWLARAEFTLGLAVAVVDSLSAYDEPVMRERLIDATTEVQLIRSCLSAAELGASPTAAGHMLPSRPDLAAAAIQAVRARPRVTEILRLLCGSAGVLAPTDSDLDDPAIGASLEQAFGGGGYTARQRSALLHLVMDHLSSGLEAREYAYELFSNGGMAAFRDRLRRGFADYTELANAAVASLNVGSTPYPRVDAEGLGRERRRGPGG